MSLKKKELVIFARDFPNSVIADMLTHFDKKTVVKLIEFYGGDQVSIPSIKTIWTNYRNRAIKDELDKMNSKEIKGRLAEKFGLSISNVSKIYYQVSCRGIAKVKYRTIKKIVDIILRKNLRIFWKSKKDIIINLERKNYSIRNILDNPEILFLFEKERDALIEQCREDIKNHLVFSDREIEEDIAAKLLFFEIDKILGKSKSY